MMLPSDPDFARFGPVCGYATAAARGWHVFPLPPGSKQPAPGFSWARHASSDLAANTWPASCNYGIACKPSGLVVLDLDVPKPGWRWPAEWQGRGCTDGRDVLYHLAGSDDRWPGQTFRVLTPRNGLHLYFAAPAGARIGNRPLGPLVDVRGGGDGEGGYVLGPGSCVGGGYYVASTYQPVAMLPAWIAELLDPPRPAYSEPPRPAVLSEEAFRRYSAKLMEVRQAPEGSRNDTLNAVAFGLIRKYGDELGAHQLADALLGAACNAGLSPRESFTTICSAFRAAGVEIGPMG